MSDHKSATSLKNEIEKKLNEQIEREAYAAFFYYSVASWMDEQGYTGATNFFFGQGDEEWEHMKKIFHFVNRADGRVVVPSIKQPPKEFQSFREAFKQSLENEKSVTKSIHEIVDLCLSEKDYTTFNFLQWYVDEQLEEEDLFSTLLDKIDILEDSKGFYLLDQELEHRGKAEG